jgi:hypothetical protein
MLESKSPMPCPHRIGIRKDKKIMRSHFDLLRAIAFTAMASVNCFATFPSANAANITILQAGPAVVSPGAPMHFVLRIENIGSLAWNPVWSSSNCQAFVSLDAMLNCIANAGYVQGTYYLYPVAFKMDSVRPFDTTLGGNALVPLPGPVQPGQVIELQTTIAAPLAPGSYSFSPWMGQGYYNFTNVGLSSGEEGYNNAPKFPFIVAADAQPPSILLSGMLAGDCSLWPPNGKLVTVGSASASDSGTGLASLTVTATSNDPSTLPTDIAISGTGIQPRTVQLAAKRPGTLQEGRVYTLTFVATDNAGNVFESIRRCVVPHDKSSK